MRESKAQVELPQMNARILKIEVRLVIQSMGETLVE